jgi:serine/threonine protein kinase
MPPAGRLFAATAWRCHLWVCHDTGRVGTATHASPDIFTGSHSSAVDLWSLGVCVVEMLTVCPAVPNLPALLHPAAWSTERWVKWLQRFTQGQAIIPGRIDCLGAAAGPTTVRSFVAACCAKSTASLQQRLAELTAHRWLHEG